MPILATQQISEIKGIKFELFDTNGQLLGRAILYILRNNLHKDPFGFIEDVFVEPDHRGKGIAGELIVELEKRAREENCYKLIGCFRNGEEKEYLHHVYGKLGFDTHYGNEFRKDLL